MDKINTFRAWLAAGPLAVCEDVLQRVMAVADSEDEDGFAAVLAAIAGARRPAWEKANGVAVLPLHGFITQRPSWWGTSTREFAGWLRQAMADDSVKAVLIDVDSPGGGVAGVEELASEIRAARSRKPIVATANSLAASAAYWIASAASELVVAPSGDVGSIGVFMVHLDYSKALADEGVKPTIIKAGKHKVEANPYEPLSEAARAALQDRVDEHYSDFIGAVAAGRGVGEDAVRKGYGEGRLVSASKSVEAGMADRIETFDETLARLSGGLVVADTTHRAEESGDSEVQADADRARALDVKRRLIQLAEVEL